VETKVINILESRILADSELNPRRVTLWKKNQIKSIPFGQLTVFKGHAVVLLAKWGKGQVRSCLSKVLV
jgi:hypothetical protein